MHHLLSHLSLTYDSPPVTYQVRSVKPPVTEASLAVASGGNAGRGAKGGGGAGNKGGGGGKGGGGKGEVARERDGGFQAVAHAKRLRAMGTRKLLLELDEDEAKARGRRGGGLRVRGQPKHEPKPLRPEEIEKELNSRVARVMQALRIEVRQAYVKPTDHFSLLTWCTLIIHHSSLITHHSSLITHH